MYSFFLSFGCNVAIWLFICCHIGEIKLILTANNAVQSRLCVLLRGIKDLACFNLLTISRTLSRCN